VVHFTLRHRLQLTPERYWALFFDRDFNDRLYAFLEFPSWKIVEQREDTMNLNRVVRAVPKIDLPPAVAKLLGSGFGYSEEGRFEKATQTYFFDMKPGALQGKLRNEAVMRCEPNGADRCTRIVEVTAEAKVFGLGGVLEGVIEKNHRATWEKSVAFYDLWAKEHPLRATGT